MGKNICLNCESGPTQCQWTKEELKECAQYKSKAIASIMRGFSEVKEMVKPQYGEWISVKDRLPEVGQYVLVFRPLANKTNDSEIVTDVYIGKVQSSPQGVEHGFERWCHPTYWMPLPEPPKEE